MKKKLYRKERNKNGWKNMTWFDCIILSSYQHSICGLGLFILVEWMYFIGKILELYVMKIICKIYFLNFYLQLFQRQEATQMFKLTENASHYHLRICMYPQENKYLSADVNWNSWNVNFCLVLFIVTHSLSLRRIFVFKISFSL